MRTTKHWYRPWLVNKKHNIQLHIYAAKILISAYLRSLIETKEAHVTCGAMIGVEFNHLPEKTFQQVKVVVVVVGKKKKTKKTIYGAFEGKKPKKKHILGLSLLVPSNLLDYYLLIHHAYI
jgi:hypothetical protein